MTQTLSQQQKGVMMSELHLQLTELLEAGTDMWDIDEAYMAACERDFELAATCIHDHPREYLRIIEAWFLQDLHEDMVGALA